MASIPLSPDSRDYDCGLDMPLIRLYGAGVRQSPSPLKLHRNDGFEITLLLDGAVRWEIPNFPPLCLSGGDMCLMQPRVPHRSENDIFAPCTLLWMVFDPRHPHAERNTPFSNAELKRMDKRLKTMGNRAFRASDHLLRLAQCWWQFIRTHPQATPEQIPLVRCFLCGIISMVWAEAAEGSPEQISPAIRRALDAIEKRIDAPHTVPNLARLAGLSQSRFYELFRREVGLSPASYIQQQRCAYARQLLRTTTLGITEVAFRCGFSSSQYFARCFQHFSACTPSTYRQSVKKET